MNDQPINPKQLAALEAVRYIENGMIVGLGTGSTAYWAIEKIGEMVSKNGLQIRAIATSTGSEEQARGLGIPIVSFAEAGQIDVTIDGADETDDELNLIKGGGGALLREKIVASNSNKLIIIADESKLVKELGKFPLPVEVTVFGWEKTFARLQALGCLPKLRMKAGRPYITDNSNYIVDCAFGEIAHPATLHDQINAIVGVVENGLFIKLASRLIVGCTNGELKFFPQ
jgi:ribose 5-phosphate isomerase A